MDCHHLAPESWDSEDVRAVMRLLGSRKSAAETAAARRNGKLGGRPRKKKNSCADTFCIRKGEAIMNEKQFAEITVNIWSLRKVVDEGCWQPHRGQGMCLRQIRILGKCCSCAKGR